MDHVIEHTPGHGHDHGHHHHDHGAADYYLEQLLTIFVCGAFGVVGILMSRMGMLNGLLAPEFHNWVIGGGVLLIVFTVIRGVSVWQSVGATQAAEAGHVHGPDCDHDHDHGPAHGEPGHVHGHGCSHGHAHGGEDDDGHSHGNIFWRIVVLSFPLLLFCLGLPNERFLENYRERKLGKDADLGAITDVADKGETLSLDFAALAMATLDPEKRIATEGMTTSLTGQIRRVGSGDREFSLYRLKMTCCAADMIPLKARILTDSVPIGLKEDSWVKVTGVVQFVEIPGKNQYLPVLRVKPGQGGLVPTPPES